MPTPPIVEWIHSLAGCLNAASETIASSTIGPIKNFRCTTIFDLKEPYSEKDKPHVLKLILAYTHANDAVFKGHKLTENTLEFTVALKGNHGPEKNNDPFKEKPIRPMAPSDEGYRQRRNPI